MANEDEFAGIACFACHAGCLNRNRGAIYSTTLDSISIAVGIEAALATLAAFAQGSLQNQFVLAALNAGRRWMLEVKGDSTEHQCLSADACVHQPRAEFLVLRAPADDLLR